MPRPVPGRPEKPRTDQPEICVRTKLFATLMVAALSVGGAVAASSSASAAENCRTIPVNADAELTSDIARADFGVDGTGVKVGIISGSFNLVDTGSTWEQNIAQGLLPGEGNPCGWTTPVVRLSEPDPKVVPASLITDEGRAMAQVVHGIAPGRSSSTRRASVRDSPRPSSSCAAPASTSSSTI